MIEDLLLLAALVMFGCTVALQVFLIWLAARHWVSANGKAPLVVYAGSCCFGMLAISAAIIPNVIWRIGDGAGTWTTFVILVIAVVCSGLTLGGYVLRHSLARLIEAH